MYTYRESIPLGQTSHSEYEVETILRELRREWHGHTYDLLAKNCNHFCDAFCERLGVPKIPGWVNRFANAGDATLVAAANTAEKFRQAKTEIVTASKVAYRFLMGVASKSSGNPESPTTNGGSPRAQTWFKSLLSAGDKPSSSTSEPSGNSRSSDISEDTLLPIEQYYLMGVASNSSGNSESPTTNGGSPRAQTWFKSLLSAGEKPSSSTSEPSGNSWSSDSSEDTLLPVEQNHQMERDPPPRKLTEHDEQQ